MPRKTRKADDSLVLALARGLTIQDAADDASVNRSTVYRRLADSAFRKRIDRLTASEERGPLVREAIKRLQADSAAVDALRQTAARADCDLSMPSVVKYSGAEL